MGKEDNCMSTASSCYVLDNTEITGLLLVPPAVHLVAVLPVCTSQTTHARARYCIARTLLHVNVPFCVFSDEAGKIKGTGIQAALRAIPGTWLTGCLLMCEGCTRQLRFGQTKICTAGLPKSTPICQLVGSHARTCVLSFFLPECVADRYDCNSALWKPRRTQVSYAGCCRRHLIPHQRTQDG